jgi:hypothetical protein
MGFVIRSLSFFFPRCGIPSPVLKDFSSQVHLLMELRKFPPLCSGVKKHSVKLIISQDGVYLLLRQEFFCATFSTVHWRFVSLLPNDRNPFQMFIVETIEQKLCKSCFKHKILLNFLHNNTWLFKVVVENSGTAFLKWTQHMPSAVIYDQELMKSVRLRRTDLIWNAIWSRNPMKS